MLKMVEKTSLVQGFTDLINTHCWENKSNTPDYILAEYLYNCLVSFNLAVNKRRKWYSKPDVNEKKT